jgi:hypothetical protein
MNCTDLDGALSDVQTTLIQHDGGFAVAASALAGISLLLLVAGGELMRPLSAIVAGVGGGVAVFVLTAAVSMGCETRLIVSGVGAILSALTAACLIRSGLFVLGAGGFAVVTHFVYDALPLHDVRGPFVLLGRSGYYYIAMLVTIVLGAAVGMCQKKHFVRVSSSLLGGGGLALTTHLVVHRTGGTLPSLGVLAILLLSTVTGVGVQHWRSVRRARRRETRPRRRRRREEDVKERV